MPATRIRHLKHAILLLFVSAGLAIAVASGAIAAEIAFPDVSTRVGETFDLPVVVREVDNLAGLKMTLTYDATLLQFVKAAKTQASGSLLHIVNSKTPGKLVVVMAGARGIRGDELTILTLTFEAVKAAEAEAAASVAVKESQLMTDSLKEIAHGIGIGKITILPPEATKTTPAETEAPPVKSADPPS